MRILLLTSVLPWPLRRNGGAQRTSLLRDALARHGEVDVLAVGDATINDEAVEAQLAAANVVGRVVVQRKAIQTPWYLPGPLGSLHRVERQYADRYDIDAAAAQKLDNLMRERKYDLVVSRYLMPAMRCGLSRYADVPTILDFDDIDHETLADNIRASPWPGIGGRLGARRALSSVRAIVKAGLQEFDHVFVTSDADCAAVEAKSVSVLPNIPFAEPGHAIAPLPGNDVSRELLFIGDLQFPPNRDGLDRFLHHVWPNVLMDVVGATVRIVGRGLSDADRARWSAVKGIDVIGFAPDLAACYARCALTIVPVYFGGGTKIKVLESLAHGRTLVTTPQAMRGYDTLRRCVRVAEDDAAFARACVELLCAPVSRFEMVERAQAELATSFSRERFERVVDEALAATKTSSF